jgi:thioredoxin 1
LDRVLENFEGRLVTAKVDVDTNQELSKEYKVMTIPTVVLFKNGEEHGRFTGSMNDKGISDALDALLDEDDE